MTPPPTRYHYRYVSIQKYYNRSLNVAVFNTPAVAIFGSIVFLR